MTRRQLTDEEWGYVVPYLLVGGYGPCPARLREQFEGVIWRFRAGAQWWEVPAGFGAWFSVRSRFRQWRDAGVFDTLLEGLMAKAVERGRVDLSLVSVESTAACARHGAAGMRLDRKCRLLVLTLTAGQAADSPQFIPVLKKVRVRLPAGAPAPGRTPATRHPGRANRAYLRERGIKAVIPEKKDQAEPEEEGPPGRPPVIHDTGLCKDRNTVERLNQQMKAWRGIATRYDCEDVRVPLRAVA